MKLLTLESYGTPFVDFFFTIYGELGNGVFVELRAS